VKLAAPNCPTCAAPPLCYHAFGRVQVYVKDDGEGGLTEDREKEPAAVPGSEDPETDLKHRLHLECGAGHEWWSAVVEEELVEEPDETPPAA